MVTFLPIATVLFGFTGVIAWAFWEDEREHLKWRKRMDQYIAEAQARLSRSGLRQEISDEPAGRH
jgi:hypothetical protein